jgi:hypothetical protein
MSKSGVSGTLQESLMLEHRLGLMYDAFDKEQNVKAKTVLLMHIHNIKQRLYKLPNYNARGLQKIMKFFKMEGAPA